MSISYMIPAIIREKLRSGGYLLLDLLFSRTKDEQLILSLTLEQLLQRAHEKETLENLGSATDAPFSYRDPIVRKIIWLLKYRGNTHAAALGANALASIYQESWGDIVHFSGNKPLLLIPIPSSKKRNRARGYNQAMLLGKELARASGPAYLEICFDVLIRNRETISQTEMKNRSERLANPKGSFSVLHQEKIKGRHILLLDDVITTGATITEAKRVLKEAGAQKVHCLALAH